MVVSHRYDFRRPSIKRAEEGIATMSANMVSIDEEPLKSDFRELARRTVQETLNALLDEEADEMVGAGRYERTAAREAYRSGHHKRKLVTTSGEVVLDVPKLRGATLLWLRGRGLSGVRLVTGDKSLGNARGARGGFPRGEMPAVRRPLLPQRVRQGAEAEADEGRQDAQGHPCAGIARGVGGEGVRGGRLARVDEAVRGSQGRARGLRRDARLHRLPPCGIGPGSGRTTPSSG
mgnify:CR=1 FL=1